MLLFLINLVRNMLFLHKTKRACNNPSALHIYYSSPIIMAKLFVRNFYLFDCDNEKCFALLSPLDRELFPIKKVKIINRHGEHIFDRVFYSLISSGSVGLMRQQQPRTSNPTVGSYRKNYRILSDPIGIRRKLAEFLVSDSDRTLLDVGMVWYPVGILAFPHFSTSYNFLSEFDTKDSDNFRRIPVGFDWVRLTWKRIIIIIIIITSHRLITRWGRLRLLLGSTCSQFLSSFSFYRRRYLHPFSSNILTNDVFSMVRMSHSRQLSH